MPSWDFMLFYDVPFFEHLICFLCIFFHPQVDVQYEENVCMRAYVFLMMVYVCTIVWFINPKKYISFSQTCQLTRPPIPIFSLKLYFEECNFETT